MFGLHFVLMVILYFLKPARDSLFLTEIGPKDLPYVYMLLAVVSIPVTQLLTYVMRRFAIRSVLIWTLAILAANILLLRWLFLYDLNWIFMAFYIWVGIFGILVISLFWILANAVFKPAQSKRIFPFLTLGAILGAICGSEASSLAVSLAGLSTENLLYICVALLGLCVIILMNLSVKSDNASGTDRRKKEKTSVTKAAQKIIHSPYQFTIAIIIGLTMMATTFTDYQFKALAFDSFPVKGDLTSFMGNFYAGISLASLGIQVLLSSQIIKRLGLGGAILSRPVGMLLGAILMAVEPVLASVVILNGFDGATRYSIDKTGRELLFLPLSQRVKDQTKIFIDIFVDRFARGLGGVLLLGFIVLLNWSVYMLTYAVIAMLILWILMGIKAKKGYVKKFRNSVQKQLIGTDSIALNMDEPTIYSVIKDSLQSDNEVQVLHTLHLLEESNVTKVVEQLKELLHHSNSDIKLKALKLLQKVDSQNLLEEIRKLLNDDDPEIRLETIYYLCQHSKEDPTSVIKSYLEHDDTKLKSAALGCASKHGGGATDLVDPDFFDRLMDQHGKDETVIKAQIADALGYIEDDKIARKYLVKLLEDKHPAVVNKAIESMGRQQNDRFIPLLIDKLEDAEYRIAIRKALASFDSDRLILYKDRFFDEGLSLTIRKGIPGIFAYLPEQTSADHLFDMLDINHPDLRYHVVKALNKLVIANPDLSMNRRRVREMIEREAMKFFKLLAIKDLQPKDRPNSILLKALGEKMGQTRERIFRLLGLIYDHKDMYGTYLALQSVSSGKSSAAVEFLDNILEQEDKKYVLPIVDDQQEWERLEKGRELFQIPHMRYDEGLVQLIEGEDPWLQTCAIYSVSPQCPANLQSKVKEAAESPLQLIKETAQLVLQRNSANV